MSPPEDREIPISLRGIENILRVLNNTLKEPSSIRQISVETDLSMRVTKNILMELENLKQVEQIKEKTQKVAKWTLTALGKKNAKAIETPIPDEENSDDNNENSSDTDSLNDSANDK